MSLKSINPFNGKIIREFEEFSYDKSEEIIRQSAERFGSWKKTGFEERNNLIKNTADVLRKNIDEYAGAITQEMGKPVKESQSEVEKCAWACDYYAQNAAGFLRQEEIRTDAIKSYVSYEPLGVILGIMPWNFPFWQTFRFAVPSIMAGNTAVLKHSSNVQICASLIEKVFSDAGFPDSVFRNLAVSSSGMERIIRNKNIKAVSLTGSEEAGRKVASIAGDELKKCVLELGGSNAFIVLEDADIDKAAETGVKARFQNAGQSCIAAKRFIVVKKIMDEFLEKFVGRVRNIRTGDPSDPGTEMGPLSGKGQVETVHDQVIRSVKMGATVIEGGTFENAFYKPTIVTNVKPGMPLFEEEVFGPVAAVIEAGDIEEAVMLANHPFYGLGVSLFTKDSEKGIRLVSEFRDGSVFINGMVKSDPRLPFGGTGRSGFGRELSVHGIREFVNVKTVWIG
jgi:succinate-semialdehyde dehydrogenase/glutarate-semialdehyde dehydrogenase